MKKILLLTIVLLVLPALAWATAEIGPRLDHALADGSAGPVRADGTWAVWVFFQDKNLGAATLPDAVRDARLSLSSRTLQRRAKVRRPGQLVDARDVPVAPSYLAAVSATGATPRRASRWLNAASFLADREQIAAIQALPCVQRVELVATFFRPEGEFQLVENPDPAENKAAEDQGEDLSYGLSTDTLEQINVPAAHRLGLDGAGVIIAQLDSGFNLGHDCLQHIPILAQYDFVHDDGNVQSQPGDHEWQHRHGTQVLSTMMGYDPGNQMGPAYGASVILAMTEDTGSETIIEEDNWVAAVEWVEGLGADLINSSLGYYYWYQYADLDGDTALTTVAADAAVERGMVVVTSAGNQRGDEDWPWLTAPADGDSVLASAAVDASGAIAGFSSPGPTADGRIKPDLSARGVEVPMAYYDSENAYMTANGTSFSSPQIAGVAALMLQRVPSLTPMQVTEALKSTASQAGAPDNDFGWGVIDAYAAATYWGAAIQHDPLPDTEDAVGPYTVHATIESRVGLAAGTLWLNWRLDGGTWNSVPLQADGPETYTADIPGQGAGVVEYYLAAGDLDGITIEAPQGGADQAWRFVVGSDVEAPLLTHHGLTDRTLASWPPLVVALAEDNIAVAGVTLEYSLNGGAVQGPFALPMVGDRYELDFPLAAGSLAPGDMIRYTLTAADGAAVPNTTTSGPWDLDIRANLGAVLVIDESVFGTREEGVPTPGTDYAQWLVQMGYVVTVVTADEVTVALLDACDAVFLTGSTSPAPLGEPLMRAYLMDYVQGGGKIMAEGGSLASEASGGLGGGYTEFGRVVLRVGEHLGYATNSMVPAAGMTTHPVMVRPNILEVPVVQDQSANPYDINGGDIIRPTADASILLNSPYNTSYARAVVYDDNSGPEAGQIVFIAAAFYYLDQEQAFQLLENGMAYLLADEAPGNGSISGTVSLSDGGSAAGAVITTQSGHSAVAGPDGQFLLSGLLGAGYTLTASLEGYGPAAQRITLAEDQQLTGVDFTLDPVTAWNGTAQPELGIPDFNEEGIQSVISVSGDGVINSINVDIDIEHNSIGHLLVTLTSPQGTTVTLHDHTGSVADDIIGNWPGTLLVDGPGSLEDFLGEPMAGDWTLHVSDSNFGATGTLHSWGLNLLVAPDALSAVPESVPAITRLVGNVPNPFNPQTRVVFELARADEVRLEIYDVRGYRVRNLLSSELGAGRHAIIWNGRDDGGRSVASGIYYCRMQAAGQNHLIKMALVR